MRVLKLGLLSSIALVVFGAAFSAEVNAQDGRLIGGGSGITVFEDRNFRGDAATYHGNMSNLPSKFNNKISSVRVGNGEQWQICDQANYRGQCVNVSGEESDLRQNNWDNRISSLRRVSGGGGGWPGNPGGGWNGNTSRPPSWMVGTFHSSYPRITLTIESGGRATANLNGESFTGGYFNGRLYINNNWSTVTRSGNGIRTYNQSTGATTDYSRRGNGGGGGGGDDWDGPSSQPPSWAIGTFYADNNDASMTITRNGRVTINYQGQAFNGRYNAGQIYANGNVSSVAQTSSGFQTYNRNTGERINYRRRR